jgi:hypothetical protein
MRKRAYDWGRTPIASGGRVSPSGSPDKETLSGNSMHYSVLVILTEETPHPSRSG